MSYLRKLSSNQTAQNKKNNSEDCHISNEIASIAFWVSLTYRVSISVSLFQKAHIYTSEIRSNYPSAPHYDSQQRKGSSILRENEVI